MNQSGKVSFPQVRIAPGAQVDESAALTSAEPADGVFVGTAVVLTNDRSPRAVGADGRLKRAGDGEAVGVHVAEGASRRALSVWLRPASVTGPWPPRGPSSPGKCRRATGFSTQRKTHIPTELPAQYREMSSP
jgi:hypothetical protein